jgi:GNAT superfamily N-acetyltransferase
MASEEAHIRPYRPGDLDDLYRICLLTADSGKDATPQFHDPQLPGHIFAAPYGVLEPSLTFVAEDADGVGGYIVGARDSQEFRRKLEREWWPRLRERYPLPPADAPGQELSREQLFVSFIHDPIATPEELTASYPSHLHINLLPRLQAHGMGRRLIDTLVAALRDQGSPGLHLFVHQGNHRAIQFYRHVGFTQLPSESPQSHLFAMDLSGPP